MYHRAELSLSESGDIHILRNFLLLLNFDKTIFVVFPFGTGNDKDEQIYVKTSRMVNKTGRKITKTDKYNVLKIPAHFTLHSLRKHWKSLMFSEIVLP